MAFKGKSRDFATTDFVKQVGVFEGKIIAINPDKEELEDILGKEVSKEVEYLSEDREGNDQVRLDFWIKDVNSDFITKLTQFISDTPITTKDGAKTKYINTQGRVSYFIDDEKNLPGWFSEYDYWQAKKGEDDLYGLLDAWLQIDTYSNKSAELYVDIKKILRGNVKELRSIIGDEDLEKTILFNSIIKVSTKEDEDGNVETKEYANLFSKSFLPGSMLKFFNLYGDKLNTIIHTKDSMSKDEFNKSVGSFPKSMIRYANDCAYNIKDFYTLTPLHDYNPEENIVSGNDALISEEEVDSPKY